MIRLNLIVCVVTVAVTATHAFADDGVWSPGLDDHFASTATTVFEAATPEDRIDAWDHAIAGIDIYRDEPGAALMSEILESQYAGETALHEIQQALDDLVATAALETPEAEQTFAQLTADIAVLSRGAGLLPSEAIRVADGIEHYEASLGAARVRPLEQVLAEFIDDPTLVELIVARLGDIREQADRYRNSDDLEAADAEATAARVRQVLDLIPSQVGPAFNSPATVAFGDVLEWNGEMYAAATDGMNIVADAIETGQVDTQRYNQVRDRINGLRHGPWGTETARGFANQWCDRLSVGASPCQRVFDVLSTYFTEDGKRTVAAGLADGFALPPGATWHYTFSDPTGAPDWHTSLGGDWFVGPAPFSTSPGIDANFDGGTPWPADGADGDDLWVKRSLTLSRFAASTLRWHLGVDNGFTLYINGRLVSEGNAEGYTNRWEYSAEIPQDVLVPGLNIVAVALEDHGGETAFDMAISGVLWIAAD